MAAPSKKRCKQGSLDGFFKKQRIDSDAGNYKNVFLHKFQKFLIENITIFKDFHNIKAHVHEVTHPNE